MVAVAHVPFVPMGPMVAIASGPVMVWVIRGAVWVVGDAGDSDRDGSGCAACSIIVVGLIRETDVARFAVSEVLESRARIEGEGPVSIVGDGTFARRGQDRERQRVGGTRV